MTTTHPIGLDHSTHLRATAFPLADANGNAVSFIDEAGNVTWHGQYDAFGNIVSESNPTGSFDPRFRFSSKYLDEETGLYYYGVRYYCADMGRWLNFDPIGTRGGLLLYGFSNNSAINYIDLLGKMSSWGSGISCGEINRDQVLQDLITTDSIWMIPDPFDDPLITTPTSGDWSAVLYWFEMFLFEEGPSSLYFDEQHGATELMKSSPSVRQYIDQYKRDNKDKSCDELKPFDDTWNFQQHLPMFVLRDYVWGQRHFTASYNITISPSCDGTLHVKVDNTASMQSFLGFFDLTDKLNKNAYKLLYGPFGGCSAPQVKIRERLPHYDRGKYGIGGDMYFQYDWDEKIDCECPCQSIPFPSPSPLY